MQTLTLIFTLIACHPLYALSNALAFVVEIQHSEGSNTTLLLR